MEVHFLFLIFDKDDGRSRRYNVATFFNGLKA